MVPERLVLFAFIDSREVSFMQRSSSHLVSVKQFTRERLELLFSLAAGYQAKPPTARRNFVAMLWFLEPSTRTRLSFDVAVNRLGGSTVNVPDATCLTLAEGETLEDTLTVIAGYGDVLVLRTPEPPLLARAVECSPIPVINAGDGTNEHPTQTVLDLYSIWREFGRIDGLKILLAVDLLYARVANSLIQALALFDVDLTVATTADFQLSSALRNTLNQSNIKWRVTEDFSGAIREADALYMTRFQHHRVASVAERERLRAAYFRLTPQLLATAPAHLRVFHCLTRHDELPLEVDLLPQARYFQQAQNGVFARMAIVDQVLSGELFS